jgi:hypothetical protein
MREEYSDTQQLRICCNHCDWHNAKTPGVSVSNAAQHLKGHDLSAAVTKKVAAVPSGREYGKSNTNACSHSL